LTAGPFPTPPGTRRLTQFVCLAPQPERPRSSPGRASPPSGLTGIFLSEHTPFLSRYNAYVSGGSNPSFNSGWIDNPSDPNGPVNSIGYDGYVFGLAGATEATSTGLYMVRHRVYDPKLGR
jgi:hypothetical protein